MQTRSSPPSSHANLIPAAIHELGKLYREKLDMPNLKLPFNSRKGFYITVPLKDFGDKGIPNVFIQVGL